MKSGILNDTKKWTGRYLLIFIPILIGGMFSSESIDIAILGKTTLLVFLIPLILGFITSIVEYHLTKNNDKTNDEIIKIFDGVKISKNRSKFRLGKYDVYCELSDDLDEKLSNLISFHVPRSQINKKKKRPKIGNIESEINGIETYEIFSSAGISSNNVKKKLRTILMLR